MRNSEFNSGFFITLYDKDTLNLYLDRGIYGFLMRPEYGKIGRYSRHYAALADYACGRKGTHVFFFLKRELIYGGQLDGSEKYGCFYLNGELSPMGIKAEADLCWDESSRDCYNTTSKTGVFKVETGSGKADRCQPYLIKFKDRLGLRGRSIPSDDLYWKLGSINHPLPTNTIQGMSFCTVTPGECEILLNLFNQAEATDILTSEDIQLDGEPLPFKPEYGIQKAQQANNESHLEASIAANTDLLPKSMRPSEKDVILRQVPMSPLKPYQMDRADICYYSEDQIEKGTIPNVVIELKNKKAGKAEIEQVVRYAKWLKRIVPSDFEIIQFYLFAPDFTSTVFDYIPKDFREQIGVVQFGQDQTTLDDIRG